MNRAPYIQATDRGSGEYKIFKEERVVNSNFALHRRHDLCKSITIRIIGGGVSEIVVVMHGLQFNSYKVEPGTDTIKIDADLPFWDTQFSTFEIDFRGQLLYAEVEIEYYRYDFVEASYSPYRTTIFGKEVLVSQGGVGLKVV